MNSPRIPRSRLWLTATVAMVVVATTVAAGEEDRPAGGSDPFAPRKPQTAPAPPAAAEPANGLPLERLKRGRMQVKKTDLFGSKSWYVPPPPPPPEPPPPPSAPPLPFTFLGKIQEPAGKLTIFLAGANRVFLVTQGETIDDTYRVEGVEDGKLALTYLPLQIKQYLDLGEAP